MASAATAVLLLVVFVAFTVGRYSFLITKPEALLSGDEQAAVAKAREYALSEGIAVERLGKPRVVSMTRVYFGGQAGLGGVEVTINDHLDVVVEMSY